MAPPPGLRDRSRGRVAINLALVENELAVAGGRPPLPLPLEIPPPFSEVLPSTWLLLSVRVPHRFWMPPPPAPGAELPFTWLLLRVRNWGDREVYVVAAGDATPDEPGGGVVVDLAAIEGGGSQNVRDSAAAKAAFVGSR